MPSVHYSTATIRLPVTVTYTCEHCRQYNIDSFQSIDVKGESGGSLLGVSQKMRDAASARAQEELSRVIEDFGNGYYQKANLKCRCTSCGRSQSWSSFIVKYRGASIAAFIIGMFIVTLTISTLLRNEGETINWFFSILGFLAAVPFPVITIRNRLCQKKAAQLEEKYKPHLTLREK